MFPDPDKLIAIHLNARDPVTGLVAVAETLEIHEGEEGEIERDGFEGLEEMESRREVSLVVLASRDKRSGTPTVEVGSEEDGDGGSESSEEEVGDVGLRLLSCEEDESGGYIGLEQMASRRVPLQSMSQVKVVEEGADRFEGSDVERGQGILGYLIEEVGGGFEGLGSADASLQSSHRILSSKEVKKGQSSEVELGDELGLSTPFVQCSPNQNQIAIVMRDHVDMRASTTLYVPNSLSPSRTQ